MASNKMLIDASHPEETRVVVLRGNRIEEYDFESQNKRQLKGNIYLAKVTRVEPSLQAAFVDYGGNRHGFLAFNEIHPDYYQIPVADRQALLDEEAADAKRDNAEEDLEPENSTYSAEDEVADDEAKEEKAPEEEKSKRRKRRPRRKTAASKSDAKSDAKSNDSASETNTGEDPVEPVEADEDESPTSIAAMMETDSISEPAPDEEQSEDSGDDEAAQEVTETKPAAKRRSTRRPRKVAAKKAEAAEENTSDTSDDVKKENAPSVSEQPAAEDNSEQPQDEAKPKTRRRRKSSGSRSKKDTTEKNNTADKDENSGRNGVESVGQNDASEEVPPRRRPRRQYKIQEVIKRRQVLLVQVVKEERGNKGAALTTYLSLAGRYSVLMPNTARGGGISRKITNAPDRKRLKAIATNLEVPEGMGVILRTAGASRDSDEIQRDFEYLMRLWEQVRALTLSSSAPCLVYEEGSLIKRSIRDLYDKNTGEITVAGENGFREARDFMEMLMPGHTSKIKLYQDEQAMFARFGVETQLDKMLSQQVTLKSGGYLVIDQTEALVAIDVNSGRATREHSIEETALQTNLETAEEVARQLRLRDLAGLIVIDFIDMEENRNNRAVEKKLKECLKHDRARIQVGRISHFGLMEMSRQRMRASVLDSTMDVCAHCQGKGHIRSNPSVGLHILRSIEEHLLKNSKFDLVVKAASEIALYMLNHKRQALMEIESRFGLKIFVEGNRDLLGENFTIDKGEPSLGERVPISHIKVGQLSDAESDADSISPVTADEESDKPPKRKRRRRRGRGNDDENAGDNTSTAQSSEPASEPVSEPAVAEVSDDTDEPAKPKRSRGKRGGRNSRKPKPDHQDDTAVIATTPEATQSDEPPIKEDEPEAPRSRNSRPRKAKPQANSAIKPADETPGADSDATTSDAPPAAEPPKAKRRPTKRRPAKAKAATATSQEDIATAEIKTKSSSSESDTSAGTDETAKEEKKGGWWSRSGFFN